MMVWHQKVLIPVNSTRAALCARYQQTERSQTLTNGIPTFVYAGSEFANVPIRTIGHTFVLYLLSGTKSSWNQKRSIDSDSECHLLYMYNLKIRYHGQNKLTYLTYFARNKEKASGGFACLIIELISMN